MHDAAFAHTRALAIHPLLKGLEPEIQGAVLADLVATWLGAFRGPDRMKIREELLNMHINLIGELLAADEEHRS